MIEDKPDFEQFKKRAKEKYSRLWIVRKKIFMSGFTLPIPPFIGDVIFIDPALDEITATRVLSHELVHVAQYRKFTRIAVIIAYLFLLPSVLTLRAEIELPAYEQSARAFIRYYGYKSEEYIDTLVKNFTGNRYFFMAPFFKDRIKNRLMKAMNEEYEKTIKEFLVIEQSRK